MRHSIRSPRLNRVVYVSKPQSRRSPPPADRGWPWSVQESARPQADVTRGLRLRRSALEISPPPSPTRQPVGEWLGFDIVATAGPNGVGLAQSAVRDERGELARSAQSLIVGKRALHTSDEATGL